MAKDRMKKKKKRGKVEVASTLGKKVSLKPACFGKNRKKNEYDEGEETAETSPWNGRPAGREVCDNQR